MRLDRLPRLRKKRRKRVGRGYGSGKGGHTVGRGSKGYKARGKVGLTFAGTKIKKSWLKRLPLWRGKGRLKKRSKPQIISLTQLEKYFRKGEKVTEANLAEKGIIASSKKNQGVKILARGKISKRLVVAVACSQKAAAAIKKVGGEIISSETKNGKNN